MSEKVLGFKDIKSGQGNAVVYFDERNIKKIKCKLGNNSTIIQLPKIYSEQISFKQVPVVSLEELKKWCKEKSKVVGLGVESRGFMLGRDSILKDLISDFCKNSCG